MSDNKGKDEELKITQAICEIGRVENNCDVNRFTRTNTPDNGADIIFYCPENMGEKLTEIANQGESKITLSEAKPIAVRIDVKARDGKIQKADAEKLVADVKKHPDCQEHWLVGGSGVTKPAKRILDEANEWTKIRNFSQKEFEQIEQYYRQKRLGSEQPEQNNQ